MISLESVEPDSRCADRERCFEILRAVNPAPKANRKRGPKVFAAVTPTKYKPGTEDSKFDDSTGVCSTDRIPLWRSASMKLNLRRSTLYPVAAMTWSTPIILC